MQSPIRRFGYVALFLLSAWILLTFTLYRGLDSSRIINTRVDFANTNACTWPSHTVYVEGAIELLVQGSVHLREDVDYSVFIHITFLDSWTTAMSGLVTFLSECSPGHHTISSLLPCGQSPIIWLIRHLLFCPAYVTGVVRDILERDVLITTSFRYRPGRWIDVPVYPVSVHRVDYSLRIQVVPPLHEQLPDIVSMYASYHLTSNTSWCWTCLWYGYIICYIYITLVVLVFIGIYVFCVLLYYIRSFTGQCSNK